jgi:hypothetical protein
VKASVRKAVDREDIAILRIKQGAEFSKRSFVLQRLGGWRTKSKSKAERPSARRRSSYRWEVAA